MPLLQRLGSSPKGEHALAVYRLRRAESDQDLQALQRLRFEVFNLEMAEGLQSSHRTGLDQDEFDAVCEHLVVEHVPSGTVVGTYRMQTGRLARERLGYYCANEFDMSPYEPFRSEVLELGRACIHAGHRNFSVLSLLWRGIAEHASATGSRYLLGCSSISSRNPADGWRAYRSLHRQLAPEHLRTVPHPTFACESAVVGAGEYPLPKLLSAYLALGAWVCGPPALDSAFGTIDFLTLMDLDSPGMAQRRRRFGMR